MTEQIQKALELSSRLRRLLKAKQAVGETLYVLVHGDIFLQDPLKEFLNRLEDKILTKRSEIRTVIESIPGYIIGLYNKVDYISNPDIIAGEIELFVSKEKTTTLNLKTGEIVSTINRPPQVAP